MGNLAGWSGPLQFVTGAPRIDAERRTWSGRHIVPDKWSWRATTTEAGRSLDWAAEILGLAEHGLSLNPEGPDSPRRLYAISLPWPADHGRQAESGFRWVECSSLRRRAYRDIPPRVGRCRSEESRLCHSRQRLAVGGGVWTAASGYRSRGWGSQDRGVHSTHRRRPGSRDYRAKGAGRYTFGRCGLSRQLAPGRTIVYRSQPWPW